MIDSLVSNIVALGATVEGAKEYINFCLSRRTVEAPFEKHHIVMKSVDPTLSKVEWNIVPLTFSDHIHAHILLYQVTKHWKALNAVVYVFRASRDGARQKALSGFSDHEILEVAKLKQQWAATPRSPDVRAKMSKALKGRKRTHPVTLETREKLRSIFSGRLLSPEHKESIRLGHIGKPLSAEHRAKVSSALQGRSFSLSHRERISTSHQGKKNEYLKSLNLSRKGQQLSPEHCNKIRQGLLRFNKERKSSVL